MAKCAEDAELTFFILFFTVLYCDAYQVHTIIWYLNFSSAFHLLQDYFTVVKWKVLFSQRFIAELYI